MIAGQAAPKIQPTDWLSGDGLMTEMSQLE